MRARAIDQRSEEFATTRATALLARPRRQLGWRLRRPWIRRWRWMADLQHRLRSDERVGRQPIVHKLVRPSECLLPHLSLRR